MAMTAAVKDELSRVEITKSCCRKAEVSTILRFAGGLHIVAGHIVIEADVDTGATARRLRKDIFDVYGHESDVAMVQSGGLRKGTRYLVRVVDAHTLEVTVDRHEALNGLFERLSAKGIAVSSMRNKANRLEELFVALLHKNKAGEAA